MLEEHCHKKLGQDSVEDVLDRIVAMMDTRRLSVPDFMHLMDENGDGELDKEELLEGLASLGLAINEYEVGLILHKFDDDGGGTLDFFELSAELAKRRGEPMVEDCVRSVLRAVYTSGSTMDEFLDELDRASGRTDSLIPYDKLCAKLSAMGLGESEVHVLLKFVQPEDRRAISKDKFAALLRKIWATCDIEHAPAEFRADVGSFGSFCASESHPRLYCLRISTSLHQRDGAERVVYVRLIGAECASDVVVLPPMAPILAGGRGMLDGLVGFGETATKTAQAGARMLRRLS